MDHPDHTTREIPAQTDPKNPRLSGGPLSWILLCSRGLIINQHLRRVTMFYVVIGALVTAFVASMFVSDWIDPRANFWWFALDTLGCGLLTLFALLLTTYDLLLVRAQHRLLERKLRRDMLGNEPPTRRDPES